MEEEYGLLIMVWSMVMVKDQPLHSVYLLLSNVYEIINLFFRRRKICDFYQKKSNVKTLINLKINVKSTIYSSNMLILNKLLKLVIYIIYSTAKIVYYSISTLIKSFLYHYQFSYNERINELPYKIQFCYYYS